MFALAAFLVLAQVRTEASPPLRERSATGEVRLPLREYLALVEKVEALESARAKAAAQQEPPSAKVVSQSVSLTLHEGEADVVSSYDVEIRGAAAETVHLPLTGMAQRITVEPPGPAAVLAAAGGLRFAAPAPGRYRVLVTGKLVVARLDGVDRVPIAPLWAPVAEVVVSLPEGRAWRCAGAVVAEDTVGEGRRKLRFALPRGGAATMEVRRDMKPVEPPKALAAAVVVTVVALGRDTVKRRDLVLYDVQRGEIGTMAVRLPAGLEPDAVVTDEGEAAPWLEAGSLRVERQKRLAGAGYLAVVSQVHSKDAISLDAVVPDCKVRARYLAFSSDVAANVTPDPQASWARVDLSDLPAAVKEAAEALGLVAAWRLKADSAVGELRTVMLPTPPMLPAIARQRDTTTLLTVENTLVHRERFVVEGEANSFEIGLPPNGTVWSAQVNGVSVRPIERGGRVLIPLGLTSSSATTVEVVVVQEQAIAQGRSTLGLELAETAVPVLRHEWRLLLPERNRYRFESGDLRPTRGRRRDEARGPAPGDPQAAGFGFGGTAMVEGRVVDSQGAAVPGASVILLERSTGRALHLKSDARGEFRLASLASGRYTMTAELSGFKTWRREIAISSGRNHAFVVTLDVGAMTETVEVGEDRALSRLPAAPKPPSEEELAAAQQAMDYRAEVDALKQGLVGGVKPVSVTIPESGKILVLAAALPPAKVQVKLAVKSPKR